MRRRRINLGIFFSSHNIPVINLEMMFSGKIDKKKKRVGGERQRNRQMDRRVASKSKETKEEERMYRERNNRSTRRIVRSTVAFKVILLPFCTWRVQ